MDLAYPDPPLSDGVVRLRAWRDDDADCVREAGTDPTIPPVTTVPAVYSVEEGVAFVRRQQQRVVDGEGISFALAEAATDRARGMVWLPLRPQAGVVGIGYWVVPDARGRGMGARGVRLVSDWALDALAMARVEAWVEPDNLASQRLLIAAGFEREGMLRSFLVLGGRRADAVVFARTVDRG